MIWNWLYNISRWWIEGTVHHFHSFSLCVFLQLIRNGCTDVWIPIHIRHTPKSTMCGGFSQCHTPNTHPTFDQNHLNHNVLALFYSSTLIIKPTNKTHTHKHTANSNSGSQIKTKVQLAAICERMQIFTHEHITHANKQSRLCCLVIISPLRFLVSQAHKLHWSH